MKNTDKVFADNFNDTLRYLISALGLFQLINYKTDDTSVWETIQTGVADIFTRNIFVNKEPVTLLDAVNLLKKIEFDNSDALIFDGMFDDEFAVDNTDQFLSGTQSLQKTIHLELYSIRSSRY